MDTLVDMSLGGSVTRRMRKGKWRGEAFCTMREWTWHVLGPALGPKSLLRPNIPSIRSGRNGRMEFHGNE